MHLYDFDAWSKEIVTMMCGLIRNSPNIEWVCIRAEHDHEPEQHNMKPNYDLTEFERIILVMGISIKSIHDCHAVTYDVDGRQVCLRLCCPFLGDNSLVLGDPCPKTHEVKEI